MLARLKSTMLVLAVHPHSPAVASEGAGGGPAPLPPWMLDPAAPPHVRAAQLVAAMTVDEKVALMHGSRLSKTKECGNCPFGKGANDCYTGNACGTARLGIPTIRQNDGPQGFRMGGARFGMPDLHSTAWPAAITIAASFDPSVAATWGESMGSEFYGLGANVQLGPGLCVARIPTGGRNFEYLSGEDPYLGSVLAGPVIVGIQSQGVIANAKHYVDNNQETERFGITEVVDERTQWEVYYPPFQAAVDVSEQSRHATRATKAY